MRRLLMLFAGCMACTAVAAAQDARGMIYGRVLDPQGTAIPGASVHVINAGTNVAVPLTSNETGYFEAAFLTAGSYRLEAEAAGFRKTIRTGITLPVGARVLADLSLELGTVTESVQVAAETPLLDVSTVTSGGLADSRAVSDMPVQGNNPMLLGALTPGVQAGGVNKYNCLHCLGGASDFSIGGKVGSNEFSMDGALNSRGGSPAFLPSTDAVQEFRVETSNFDASVAQTTGATITIMTKAGTNAFHGALSDQHWQSKWNGTPFFLKQQYFREIAAADAAGNTALASRLRSQDRQGNGRSNTYSGALGGPVIIPKLFNGKDKLFFFYNIAGYVDQKPPTYPAGATNRTIPTLSNRAGDFSQFLQVDAVRYQIYDPNSVRPDPARPSHYIRDPIPGNIIPRSRFANPMYDSYMALLPTPNNDPSNPRLEPLNNYQARLMTMDWKYQVHTARIDYIPSQKHRFFGSWNHGKLWEYMEDWTYETARGLMSTGKDWRINVAIANWVYTVNPATLIDLSLSFSNTWDGRALTKPYEYKPSDVGLPTYLDQKAGDLHILPRVVLAGYQTIGQFAPQRQIKPVAATRLNFTQVRGAHSLRAGFDVRQYYRTAYTAGNTSGNFAFGNTYTRRNDDTFTPAGDLAHSWAAFIMGVPESMSIETNDSVAYHSPYYGWYGQDNWRVTPKLSINLGLRLEYEAGGTERYNRIIGPFDTTAKLPITDAAQAAYARTPIPELGASSFKVLGGPIYPGVNGADRHQLQSELMLSPRIGIAYQLHPKTVLRAGFGIYYDTLNAFLKSNAQTGFSRTTSTNLTNDFGVNWLAGDPRNGVSPLRDPFPVRSDGTRFDMPVRDALGVMAVAGRSYTADAFDTQRSRQRRWRFGVQQQIGSSTSVEVAYVGSYSDRVYLTKNLNPLPEQYWATGMTRNNDIATNLNANVSNPFYLSNFAGLAQSNPVVYQDLSTQGFFTSSTIRKQQLLRPFPQMSGLAQSSSPAGEVRTDSLEIAVQRRLSKGLSFTFGYTRLNDREADFYKNEFDPLPSWRESNDGRPHRLTLMGIYELPFGKGRPIQQSRILNLVLGGLQLSYTYEWQPGPLLDWGNVFYYGKLEDIPLSGDQQSLDRWFNTDNFERSSSRSPAAYHARVFPTRVSGVRADMTNQWNLNAQREFRFRERWGLQFRFDALNAMNRPQFAAPSVDPLSSNFGKVTASTEAINRVVQLTARLRF